MKDIIIMCLEFFKAGLLSIGGGLATLPFLNQMADKYPWFTRSELSDMIAVSESTPGPMGVNMSTYAGYTTAGIPGAILATFSLVLPSIIIILIVSSFLQRFQESRLVSYTLCGLRPASVGLIAAAGFGILKLALQLDLSASLSRLISLPALLLGIGIAVLYHFRKKWHPIVFIGIGAAAGVIIGL